MKQQPIQLDINQSQLSQAITSIYKHLYKQHNAFVKLAQAQKLFIPQTQLADFLYNFSDAAIPNAAYLLEKVFDSSTLETPQQDSVGNGSDIDYQSKKFAKRLNIFSKLFDVVQDKFTEVEQKITKQNEEIDNKISREEFQKELQIFKEDIQNINNQSTFLNQLKLEKNIFKVEEKVNQIGQNLTFFTSDTEVRIKELEQSMRSKISSDLLENEIKLIFQKVTEDVKKQTTSQLETLTMKIHSIQNQIQVEQSSNNQRLESNALEIKELLSFVNYNCIHQDQQITYKAIQEEKLKDISQRIHDIQRKMNYITIVEQIQQQQVSIISEQTDIKIKNSQIESQIRDEKKQREALQFQVDGIDLNKGKVYELENAIKDVKETQIKNSDKLFTSLSNTESQLKLIQQVTTEQLQIFNETLKQNTFTKEEIIQIIEKEITNQTSIKNRLIQLCNFVNVMPNGTPFVSSINNLMQQQSSQLKTIEQLEQKVMVLSAQKEKTDEPVKNNFQNEFDKQLKLVYVKINALQYEQKNFLTQLAEMQAVNEFFKNLDENQKMKNIQSMIDNSKTQKKNCIVCGNGLRTHRKISEIEKNVREKIDKEKSLQIDCADLEDHWVANIQRTKTSTADRSRDTYHFTKAFEKSIKIRNLQKQI